MVSITMRLALAMLCLSVCFAAPPATGKTNGPCGADSDCSGKTSPYGFRKKNGAKLDLDTYGLKCCAGGENGCYDDRVDKCYKTDVLTATSEQTNVLCSKRWGIPCGSSCCNSYNERCWSYSAWNDGANYKSGFKCLPKLQGSVALLTIAVPILGIIVSLLALAVSLMSVKDMFSTMGIRAKSIVGISAFMVILAIFFYFSPGWKYAVIITATACLTILSLGGNASTLGWLTILAQLATFVYLLGPDFGSNQIVSFGPGAFVYAGACPSYSNSMDVTYGTWFNAQSYQSDNVYDQPGNPNRQYWGFCDLSFLEWKMLVALIEIALSGSLFVLYTIASFTAPGAMTDASKPLLG